MSDRSGDGAAGSMIRIQLRTTSSPVSGEPSENVRSGRRWNTTRRPPSSRSHDAARAGRTCNWASKPVKPSNSWAEIAALPMSPWAAGSSVVAEPMRMLTESGRAAATPPARSWKPGVARTTSPESAMRIAPTSPAFRRIGPCRAVVLRIATRRRWSEGWSGAIRRTGSCPAAARSGPVAGVAPTTRSCPRRTRRGA